MKRHEAETYLAFSPGERGLLCAMLYTTTERHVMGWFTGAKGAHFHRAFFLLEDFFTDEPQRFLATKDGDLYGGWVYDYSHAHPRLQEPIPIDDDIGRTLEALQAAFATEWLFYLDTPGYEEDLARYRAEGLPLHEVNIRHKRLARLDHGGHPWEHISPNTDMNILDYIQEYWPLDYRLP
ncbi:hypothetical protein NH8B_1882 [Pseudogulbenkiania sp. NH8B]|uniref:hypothetical protein n=1 Tax=Pseudogulbenkiania sp. (strain NH8B) TaxID=748280 RepID=UPI0002279F53|nr:hypothetical protein [Pseudogulbenkiania sp. NH8B]BAK76697.1 hypothetical protein NH8B_1882 [Pseudogulbenkiania sp. NH8B]